jgi:hypothetical protein
MKKNEVSGDSLKAAFASRKAKEIEKTAPANDHSEAKAAFIARFGQEQLDKWKQQFGGRELICLKVEESLAVLRPVTADDLGDYMTAIGTNGMSKAVAMVMEQLWIDGDLALIDDEDKFIAAFLQINNILEGKKATFFRI